MKFLGSFGLGVCGLDKGCKRMLISKDLFELDGYFLNGVVVRKFDYCYDCYDIFWGKERVFILFSVFGVEDLLEEFFYMKSSVVF